MGSDPGTKTPSTSCRMCTSEPTNDCSTRCLSLSNTQYIVGQGDAMGMGQQNWIVTLTYLKGHCRRLSPPAAAPPPRTATLIAWPVMIGYALTVIICCFYTCKGRDSHSYHVTHAPDRSFLTTFLRLRKEGAPAWTIPSSRLCLGIRKEDSGGRRRLPMLPPPPTAAEEACATVTMRRTVANVLGLT